MGFEFDEAFAAEAGLRSFGGIIQLLTTGEPHPPFYYSFLHLWYPIGGTTEFAIRFPTVFANVLTIGFLVSIADWFGWSLAGRIAALLVALNPWQIWYAQEARMYTPVALFGVAAVYFALRSVRSGARGDLVWYSVFVLLALLTHYYAIFLAVSVNLAVFAYLRFAGPGRLRWRDWLIPQAVVAVLYLPWLAYAYRITLYYIRTSPDSLYLPGVVSDALTYYSLGRSLPKPEETQLSLAFLAVLVVGVVLGTRARATLPRWFSRAFLLIYLLGPLTIGFVVSLVRSMYIPQYFFVSSPAFFLALGLGVAWVMKRFWPAGVVVVAGLIGMQLLSVQNYFFNPDYNKAEVVDAINYVEGHRRPGDAIILDGPGQITQFDWYHDVRWKDPTPSIVFPLLGPDNWQHTPAAIDTFMTGWSGAWFLDYGVTAGDPQRLVQAYLSENYFPALYQPIHGNRVLYFAAAPKTSPEVTALNLTCNDDVSLVGLSAYATTVPAGAVIPLTLRWQALKSSPRDYGVSWRLLDSAGHVVVQHDSRPASGFLPSNAWKAGQTVDDRFGLAIPSYASSGQYRLVAQVYDASSGQICLPARAGKPLPGIQIPLTTIKVNSAPPLPPIGSPQPQHPVNQTVGPLRFLGYDLAPGPYRPGDVVSVRLYWSVQGKVSGPLTVDGQLLGADRTSFARASAPIVASQPSGSLSPGQQLVTYLDLPVAATASSATVAVNLSLVDGNLTWPLLASPPSLRIIARPRTFTRPNVSQVLSADLGGKADLIGYDLAPAGAFAPRQTIHLTLYWQGKNLFDKSYKVFTHLVGPDGQLYGQRDSIPLDGVAPTTSWAPGEFLADHYDIAINANAPPGAYQLVVGMYDADSGARLPVDGGKTDSIVVAKVEVGTGR